MDVFDLRAKATTRAPRLSGGMRRRLLLARALMHEPRLVILDEPTAGVDFELRLELWRYIRRLHGEGTTILLTTHYLEEAEALCEDIALIRDGRRDRPRHGGRAAREPTRRARSPTSTSRRWPRLTVHDGVRPRPPGGGRRWCSPPPRSLQVGAAFAVTLFDDLGPAGAAFLRLGLAALVLWAIWRPSLSRRPAAGGRCSASRSAA